MKMEEKEGGRRVDRGMRKNEGTMLSVFGQRAL